MICILKVIHYFWLLFRNLSVRTCKISFSHEINLASSCKKKEIKSEFLTDIDLLLIVEKGIRSGICHSVNGYVKSINK